VSSSRTIGRVASLRIATADLKLGDGPYDPSRLLEVDEMWLTPRGCVAPVHGMHVLDVHHLDHPGPRRHGVSERRMVSVGFTSHHAHMADEFGHDRGRDAAENIVVETDERFTEADLAGGLALAGNHAPVWLRDLLVCEPCVQFSTYMTDSSEPAVLSDALRRLDAGVRGFVAGLGHLERPMVVRVGDEVLLG
jgi:hypothetical protein